MHTTVATADENPRSFPGSYIISVGHGEVDILREVNQVVDGLLDSMNTKTGNAEVREGVR